MEIYFENAKIILLLNVFKEEVGIQEGIDEACVLKCFSERIYFTWAQCHRVAEKLF